MCTGPYPISCPAGLTSERSLLVRPKTGRTDGNICQDHQSRGVRQGDLCHSSLPHGSAGGLGRTIRAAREHLSNSPEPWSWYNETGTMTMAERVGLCDAIEVTMILANPAFMIAALGIPSRPASLPTVKKCM